MQFNAPRRNNIMSPLSDRPPLRADGNLRYLDFIRLVRKLWEDSHPDIPIKPVQSKSFTDYPIMTYSLQLRKTHSAEPKPKIREEIINDEGELYIVTGQRFENVIVFTVITQLNPLLAEEIIETFEDFMQEWTPLFKRLGASEFIYSRRLPDSEQTRQNEDVETRAVAYMFTEERTRQLKVDRLKDVLVNARVFLEQQPTNFTVVGSNQYLILDTGEEQFLEGQPVVIYGGLSGSASLPPKLHHGYKYIVSQVSGNTIYLNDLQGNAVDPGGAGAGRILPDNVILMPANIEDLYASATPRTS